MEKDEYHQSARPNLNQSREVGIQTHFEPTITKLSEKALSKTLTPNGNSIVGNGGSTPKFTNTPDDFTLSMQLVKESM